MTPRGWLYTQVRATAVLGGISLFFLVVAPRLDKRDFSDLEAREPASLAILAQTQPGSEVLVEARVPASAPSRNGLAAYVAYLLEQSTNSDEPMRETEMERSTPPLVLEMEGGRITVENDRYDLKQVPVVTRDAAIVRRGLVAGDQVLVFGKVTRAGADARLRASIIAKGTKESYLHNLKGGRRMNRYIGLFFASFAGVVFLVSTRSALRRSRRNEYVSQF